VGNAYYQKQEVTIEFDCSFTVKVLECSLSEIITAFCSFLPNLLTDFIMKVLLGYAEYVMSLGNKPFSCEICGNNHYFIWKTRHGKTTRILTIFQWVVLHQLQVQ